MIAFVDTAPEIELRGENFLITLASGDSKSQFMLTANAFFAMRNVCAEAYAKRQIAELEAREKLVAFAPKGKRRRR